MLYYVYFSDAGVAATSLTPSFSSLGTAQNGADKNGSAPTVSEIDSSNCPGWYRFDITFGSAPWDVTTEDLVGVIDGGSSLADGDRYKPVAITLRGLGLARVAHKGVQDKSTGDIDIYQTDGATKELKLDMTDSAASVTRDPVAAD